jgi:hypothetical protein
VHNVTGYGPDVSTDSLAFRSDHESELRQFLLLRLLDMFRILLPKQMGFPAVSTSPAAGLEE